MLSLFSKLAAARRGLAAQERKPEADPRQLRAEALYRLKDAARADGAALYRLSELSGAPCVSYWQATDDAAVLAAMSRHAARPEAAKEPGVEAP